MTSVGDFPGEVVIAQGSRLDELAEKATWLGDEERERAGRFARPDAARAFVARRALLRATLGEALGLGPAEVRFTGGHRGKPELEPDGEPLWFNLSDTAGCAIVAVSRSSPVGVDVEAADRRVDHVALANRWFTQTERARVAAAGGAPAQATTSALEFLRIWTAREAAAKLTGEGMARCLAHHEFIDDPPMVVSNRQDPAHVEALIAMEVIDGFVLAVAWPPATPAAAPPGRAGD